MIKWPALRTIGLMLVFVAILSSMFVDNKELKLVKEIEQSHVFIPPTVHNKSSNAVNRPQHGAKRIQSGIVPRENNQQDQQQQFSSIVAETNHTSIARDDTTGRNNNTIKTIANNARHATSDFAPTTGGNGTKLSRNETMTAAAATTIMDNSSSSTATARKNETVKVSKTAGEVAPAADNHASTSTNETGNKTLTAAKNATREQERTGSANNATLSKNENATTTTAATAQRNGTRSKSERVGNESARSNNSKEAKTINNGTVPTPTTISTAANTTIVVQLQGEMGNQVSKIAYALGLQLYAKEEFGISTQIKLRAQDHGKWLGAMKSTKACFPKTRPFDFRQCNTPEYDIVKKRQSEWLKEINANIPEMKRCITETCVHQNLHNLHNVLLRIGDDLPLPDNTNANISMPFVLAHTFLHADSFLIDRYYKEIRDFFTFDDSICKALPESDETVLHVRNFLTEMPKRGKGMGFEELSPRKIASELFANHKPGSKIAILSRFPKNVDEHKKALEARGFVVRVMAGQSGEEDFCFLLRAKKEIVGVFTSTYVQFAGLFGDAKRVRLYSVDSKARRRQGNVFMTTNFTNVDLISRVSFELYKAEDVEKL